MENTYMLNTKQQKKTIHTASFSWYWVPAQNNYASPLDRGSQLVLNNARERGIVQFNDSKKSLVQR